MEESTAIVKFIPGLKTKILTVMIPVVIAVGAVMIAVDLLNVANAHEQNALKAGALLLAYAAYSFRGLNRYRIFFELRPNQIIWNQGFRPFAKHFAIQYSQIESLTVTSLTSTLIISLKPESSLPQELRLAPAFRRVEGTLAKPNVENLEKEIATSNPVIRELYYLKYEIEKRMASVLSHN